MFGDGEEWPVQCPECEHEQDGGRFCGRCGALLILRDVAAGRTAVTVNGVRDQGPGDGSSRPSGGPRRRGRLVLALSSVAVMAMVTVALGTDLWQPEAGLTAAGAEGSESPAMEIGAVEGETWPIDFQPASGLTVLFDDRADGAVAVDLDTGARSSVDLPQRAGDRPHRIWRLGAEHVVVGGGIVGLDAAGEPGPVRQLPEASFFVPAADPDQLWLIEDTASRVGQHGATAGLIDVDGNELAFFRIDGDLSGLEVVRGVPGGLAVQTGDGGLHVYDLDGDLHRDFLGESAAHLVDANTEQIMWCEEPCDTLQLADGTIALDADPDARSRGELWGSGGRSFDPSTSWLSPDGRYVMAVMMTDVQDGAVDRVIRVYDARTLSHITFSASVPLGEVRGSWSPDARQFIFSISTPADSGGPQVLGRWRVGTGFRTFEVDPHLDGLGQFIALATDDVPHASE